MATTLFKSDDISVYKIDSVCYLSFNNSVTRNAISFEIANDLHKLVSQKTGQKSFLEKFLLDSGAGAFVIRSQVKNVFISGGNLKELAKTTRAVARDYATKMRTATLLISKLPVPTVTFIGAGAYGGGSEIALATDYRWALQEEAALCFYQARWGVPGGWNGMRRLQQLCPQLDARRVGLLFALQESLPLSILKKYNLVDKDFSNFLSEEAAIFAEQEAEKLAIRFLSCEEKLRQSLLARGGKFPEKIPSAQTDAKLFEKFWLNDHHKSLLDHYMKEKQ